MPISAALLEWLQAADEPSVNYRVLTDLLGRPASDPEVLAARAKIGAKGWAEEILKFQFPDGRWVNPDPATDDLYRPKYLTGNWQLLVLSELGLPALHPRVRSTIERLWEREGGPSGGLGGTGSELCFTGNALRYLSRLGDPADPRLDALVEWLVRTQKADGGWHCFESSVGTLDCWEALAGFAALARSRWTDGVRRAVERGAEFYLERRLLREGSVPYAPWFRIHYPVHYYYDFLVGLDVLTELGYGRDPRLDPAFDLLYAKRNPDGSWNLDAAHPDLDATAGYAPRAPIFPYLLEPLGQPSRWATVRALTVLRRAGRV